MAEGTATEMGNHCFNARNTKFGLFREISQRIWYRPSKGRIEYDKQDESSAVPPAPKEQQQSPFTPPQVVIIVKEEEPTKCTKWEDVVKEKGEDTTTTKSANTTNARPDQGFNPEKPIPVEPATPTQTGIPQWGGGVKRETVKPKPAAPAGPRVAKNVKRMASAGLLVDSVLRTKTGHIKEYFTFGEKLGNGQFGTTFLCVEKGTGEKYACKSIAKRKLLTQEDVNDVRREVEIMHHLSGSPSIITIKGAYEDSVAVHVVMELCTGGELFDRIVKKGHYTERKAAEIARTIVGAVETCHSLGVMHRDLKPENFLLVNDDEDSPIKAIDFGLSTYFKPGKLYNDVVGSPYYVAPEVLRRCYGPEADIWSAGVIIYILLCGAPPFWGETEEEILNEVSSASIDFTSDPWPKISDSAKDLVQKMLIRDPKKRLTAREVLCHPWVMVDGVAPDKPFDSAVLTRLTRFSAMNKFKKMALRVIAERLSEEEIAGLKEIFKMIDADNSGQITFEELKIGLKKFGANLNESEIHNLMQAADIDNNGTIDYTEFIAATLHLNKIEKEDHLYAAFSYFDKDGSGYITLDELQKACQEFGISDVHLEEIIKEADQNDDGRIDYNEFAAMMHKELADMGTHPFRNCLNIGFRETTQVC